jgi:hypothetical protein
MKAYRNSMILLHFAGKSMTNRELASKELTSNRAYPEDRDCPGEYGFGYSGNTLSVANL